MRYGFNGMTQKPSNSSLCRTAPSSSHQNNARQYIIKHMHSVIHSAYVGLCIDCKNMHSMNNTKNARQGCSNANSMLILLSDIHGVHALWISSQKLTVNHYYYTYTIQGLVSPPWKHTSLLLLCVWIFGVQENGSHSTPSLFTRFNVAWILLSQNSKWHYTVRDLMISI